MCGDPDCAPIDTAVRIIYEGKAEGPVGTAFAFPCEAVELTREALDERMPPASTFEDWYEGKPTHWPPGITFHDIVDDAGVGSHPLVRVEGCGPLQGGIRILLRPLLGDGTA